MVGRTCEDCKRFVYRDSPSGMGEMIVRGDGPMKRSVAMPTPCSYCPKIASGEEACPENGRHSDLTPENHEVLRHYMECKATGLFPDDPIVRQNAGIIRMVEDGVRKIEQDVQHETLVRLLASRVL